MENRYEALWPRGRKTQAALEYGKRLKEFSGKRIAQVWNDAFRGNALDDCEVEYRLLGRRPAGRKERDIKTTRGDSGYVHKVDIRTRLDAEHDRVRRSDQGVRHGECSSSCRACGSEQRDRAGDLAQRYASRAAGKLRTRPARPRRVTE